MPTLESTAWATASSRPHSSASRQHLQIFPNVEPGTGTLDQIDPAGVTGGGSMTARQRPGPTAGTVDARRVERGEGWRVPAGNSLRDLARDTDAEGRSDGRFREESRRLKALHAHRGVLCLRSRLKPLRWNHTETRDQRGVR